MLHTYSDMNERTNHFYPMTWNEVHIPTRDGGYLAANLYRPAVDGRFPVLMTLGPYGKDVHFLQHNPMASALYAQLQDKSPLIGGGTPDPEFWAPQGYAVVRIDQRGTGNTPGKLEVFSESLKYDYFDAIEWAGTQPWSSGKVGLLGVSYYAVTQWAVAAEQPPHLSCIVAWEGTPDLYADIAYAGGIQANVFVSLWWQSNILPRQYGKGRLTEEELQANRVDLQSDIEKEPLREAWWKNRSADLAKVEVPLLSAGNWFSAGFFARGNIEGFTSAASQNRWLEMHIGSHFIEFYNEDSRALQKQFLDYWLKGIDTGLLRQPKVKFALPEGSKDYTWRYANEYPLKSTRWTRYYLDAPSLSLCEALPTEPGNVAYQGDKNHEEATWEKPMRRPFNINAANPHHVTFRSGPLQEDIQIAGPMKLRLYASSSINDMDIFVTLRNIDATGQEVLSAGCYTLDYPISQGWLRASLRKIDERLSTEYKPYYTFDEVQKLVPGNVYCLDIEIWDSAMLLKEGHELVLEIGGQDQSGCSLSMHTGKDRIWDADVTIYTGGDHSSYLLLPIIPD